MSKSLDVVNLIFSIKNLEENVSYLMSKDADYTLLLKEKEEKLKKELEGMFQRKSQIHNL